MATKQQWAEGLQGMGAWFAGQGPQYEAAQALQARTAADDERQRKLDELAMNKERVAAMTQDFSQTLSLINSGRPDLALQLLDNRLPLIEKMGGDTYHTKTLRDKIAENSPDVVPELTAFLTAAGKMPAAGSQYSGIFTTADNRRAGLNTNTGMVEILPSQPGITARAPESAQLPASLQEMAWLNSPQRTPAELDMYWRNKRAEQIVAAGGGSQISVSPSGQQGVIVTPEDATSREAAQAAAVKGAEATAAADVERQTAQRGNRVAYDAYQQAMNAIRSSFGKTETGPVSGRMPAVTVGQQTAEGSVAAAAPVLKQLFRSAGEGVFTDKDQQLLLDMMPKRTDHPEVVASKLQMVDAVVAAKLNMSNAPATAEPPASGGFKIKSVK